LGFAFSLAVLLFLELEGEHGAVRNSTLDARPFRRDRKPDLRFGTAKTCPEHVRQDQPIMSRFPGGRAATVDAI
jgi:hypothetical protein